MGALVRLPIDIYGLNKGIFGRRLLSFCCGLVYFALFEAGMPDPLHDAIALPVDVLSDGGHPEDLVLDLRGRRERGTALKTLEDLVLDDDVRGDGGRPRGRVGGREATQGRHRDQGGDRERGRRYHASRGRFRGWCYPKTWIRGCTSRGSCSPKRLLRQKKSQ